MSKKMNAKTEKKVSVVIVPSRNGCIGEDIWTMVPNKITGRYDLAKNGKLEFSGSPDMCLGKAEILGVEWE